MSVPTRLLALRRRPYKHALTPLPSLRDALREPAPAGHAQLTADLPALVITGRHGPLSPGVTHLISVSERGQAPPAWAETALKAGVQVLALQGEDVYLERTPEAGRGLGRADLERVQDLSGNLGQAHTLQLHCHAGISRSTALALHALASTPAGGELSDLTLSWVLLAAREHASPNQVLLKQSDRLLGRDLSGLWRESWQGE